MHREIIGAWDPEVIDQAIPQLEKKPRTSGAGTPGVGSRRASGEPPVELTGQALIVWQGEDPKLKEGGEVDRSTSLVKIGRVLYDAGANGPVILDALAERDEALGWRKYTERGDAGEQYEKIQDMLELEGRNGTARASASGSTKTAKSAPVALPGSSEKSTQGYNLTDLGNSERFIGDHGKDVRYCHPWGKWLLWTGTRWALDENGQVHQLAKRTVRRIYEEAAKAENDERRKELAKHAAKSEAEARIQSMLGLAKSDVPISPRELDADPWLLGVPNGTIDLRTGELRYHRREDLITKLSPVEYDPEARAETWEVFLERVLPSEKLRQFVQRLSGYVLTGDVSEQILPFLHGAGANGKTTFLNAILEVAGDYGQQAPPDLLLAKRGSHPTELADLFGARLVAAVEIEDGRKMAEGLVKQLTGGDRIKARRMREDFWEFAPTHKVFLGANHKPEVRGTDHAIWRRIKLIPFDVTIPKSEQDPKLSEKLTSELPGILAWAVRGCLEWQREGLGEPEEVTAATQGYRAEMDVLAAFIDECCVVRPDATAASKALYETYTTWSDENGERAEKQRSFGARLTERGFERGRGSGNIHIRLGIGLRTDREPNPNGGSDPSPPESDPKSDLTSAKGHSKKSL